VDSKAESTPATWSVIIFDRYHHREPDSEILIEGFPSRELARGSTPAVGWGFHRGNPHVRSVRVKLQIQPDILPA